MEVEVEVDERTKVVGDQYPRDDSQEEGRRKAGSEVGTLEVEENADEKWEAGKGSGFASLWNSCSRMI